MIDRLLTALIDRPPINEGWHLLVLLAAGVVVVAILHRHVRRQVALIGRKRDARDDR